MLRASKRHILILFTLGLLILASAYAGLALYKADEYTTTPPTPVGERSPEDVGLPYESVSFTAANDESVVLSGWWIPREGASRSVVLVHGRYQNRTAMLGLAQRLWERGYNILLFDLRGHGDSTPSPASYGLTERWDVVGAVDYVAGLGLSRQSIGVVGWSLGGASALMAMEQPPGLQAVVSDSAYAGGDPLLADNLLRPGLKLVLALTQNVDVDTVQPAESVRRAQTGSVLLIHGSDDRSVSVDHLRRIESAGGDRVVETWIVAGAGHIGSYGRDPDTYAERVDRFFESTLSPNEPVRSAA